MILNLASGPLNMIRELVFVRLYMTSKNAVTLKYDKGAMKGQPYKPSDDLESMLYSYKSWMIENHARGIVQKELPGLYPIPSISWYLADFLYENYKTTRFEVLDRESWMRLVCKAAGGLALGDSGLSLTAEEAAVVDTYDRWCGAIDVDVEVTTVRSDVMVAVTEGEGLVPRMRSHATDELEVQTAFGRVDTTQSAMCVALRAFSGKSVAECRGVLTRHNWDLSAALAEMERK